MNKEYIFQELLKALGQKLNGLTEFCKLTSQQQKAVQEDNINELNAIIQEKQQIINAIDEINKGISRNESLIGANSLSDCDSYRDLTKRINDQLIQAKKLDEEVRVAFHEQAKKMFKAIEELRLGRRTVTSYYKKNAQVQGYFIDKKK